MASVLPRKNAKGVVTWRVQYRIDGKMRQQSFETEKEARAFGRQVDNVGAAAAHSVIQQRRCKAAKPQTFLDFAKTYLDPASGLLTGIEARTRQNYESIVQRSFAEILGPLVLEDITKSDVGQWVAWQEEQPSGRRGATGRISAKTVKNYHALLSAIFAAAQEQKLIERNPAYKIRLTRGRSREGVFLSRVEFGTLLHFIPEYYRPLVSFLAGTGTRWGEATAATWGDVELSTSPATVRIDKAWKTTPLGTVIGTPKTERSKRTISLWPELVGLLGTPKPGDQLLFPGMTGVGQVWYGPFLSRIWKPAVEKANDEAACAAAGRVPIGKTPNIHDLRHSHASWLVAAGTPLPFVQVRLGHESITTTANRYTHLLPAAHVEMAAIMADTLRDVIPQAAVARASAPQPALPEGSA